MLDLLITQATLPDGRQNMAVAVQDGKIVEVTEGLSAPAHETVDAQRLPAQPAVCGPALSTWTPPSATACRA
jgi:cytosine deaminase